MHQSLDKVLEERNKTTRKIPDFKDTAEWAKIYTDNKSTLGSGFVVKVIICVVIIIVLIVLIWVLFDTSGKKKRTRKKHDKGIIKKMSKEKYKEPILHSKEVEYRDEETGNIISLDDLNGEEYEVVDG